MAIIRDVDSREIASEAAAEAAADVSALMMMLQYAEEECRKIDPAAADHVARAHAQLNRAALA